MAWRATRTSRQSAWMMLSWITLGVSSPTWAAAPVADAGPDHEPPIGMLVTLQGGNSYTDSGTPDAFAWRLLSRPPGSTAALERASFPVAWITPDVPGEYLVELKVLDGQVWSAADQMRVISHLAPVARAGIDQNVMTGSHVDLDGSASAAGHGNDMSYRWRFLYRPSLSNAVIANDESATPSFVADVDGGYLIELKVDDGRDSSRGDRVMIVASSDNSAPIANAGGNQSVELGAEVQLDARASTDVDGDPLTYRWNLRTTPPGSNAQLTSVSGATTGFSADAVGTYSVGLIANDGQIDSATAIVQIDAVNTNLAPVARAGSDQTVVVGSAAQLNASASSDPEGAALTYQWQIIAAPSPSSARILDDTAAVTGLVPDEPGSYVLGLTVNDGATTSAQDTMIVEAIADSSNAAPIAEPGQNQVVTQGDLVQLDGSASYDPDGDALTYVWRLVSRPASSNAVIADTSAPSTSFAADQTGRFVVELAVTDPSGAASARRMEVTSISSEANRPGVAVPGGDADIAVDVVHTLDGSGSYDPDGDALTYLWQLAAQPAGSKTALAWRTTENPQFKPDRVGAYTLWLKVHDGTLWSSKQFVTFTATNGSVANPIAEAGGDQTATVGAAVTLDASGSSDPQGDGLTYEWSVASGPDSGSFDNPTGITTGFTPTAPGDYLIELTVYDGGGNQDRDTVTVSADIGNQAPQANAGPDQTVTVDSIVSLDSSGSSDADGDPLTTTWVFTRRPSGSSAALSSSTARYPTFVADVAGRYDVRLTVDDGVGGSDLDVVVVHAEDEDEDEDQGEDPPPPPQSGSTVTDTFDGTGSLLGYTTNNASKLPDVSRVNGRYRAVVTNNDGNITAHFNADQGRLDAKLVTFPFEYIARNIGIGTQANSQTAPSAAGNKFMFAGVQVHVTNLNSANSAHLVVGHRGNNDFTVEGKNTRNGSSSANDDGANIVPAGRADLRIVGLADGTLRAYWQRPNPNPGVQADNWNAYRGTGLLPGTAPSFGSQVYIGLITYAFFSYSVPFVGTADSVELVGE